MINVLRGILGIAFFLGVAILVHEFGHFLWAKICGVRILKFSIGFGKFIFKWKWGETEYGVAWFPLGGYVLMHGALNPETQSFVAGGTSPEAEADVAADTAATEQELKKAASGATVSASASQVEEAAAASASAGGPAEEGKGGGAGAIQRMVDAGISDTTALHNRPYYQKVLIYSGGVMMNWIIAMLAAVVIYWVGFDAPKPPAAVVGLIERWPEKVAPPAIQVGDKIVKADHLPVSDWGDVANAMQRGFEESRDVPLEIERPGAGTLEVTMPGRLPGSGKSPLTYIDAMYPPFVEQIFPNKPADKAGMKAGDLILDIDGEKVSSWAEMAAIIRRSAGKELSFRVQRGDHVVAMSMTPEVSAQRPDEGQIGVIRGNNEREIVSEPFFTALGNAPVRTFYTTIAFAGEMGKIFKNLFHLRIKAVGEEVGGPIMVAQVAYRAAQRSLAEYLMFFQAMNLLLALFNLLPIPLLDGSHIVFSTYEAIFRRPLSPRIHVPLLYAGLALLLLITVAVSVHDVVRIFG